MKNVDVDHAGRRYRITFLRPEPGARCMGVWRKLAGGGEAAVDMFGVTGRAVIAAAREKVEA